MASDTEPRPASLTSAAVVGSLANSAQWLTNKFAVALVTLVVAQYVTPDEYGLAAVAFSVATAVLVLSPGPMGDVLIAHPRSLAALAPVAWRLSAVVAAGMTALTLLSIPVAVHLFSKYPSPWLAWLLAALAVKPFFEALLVVPVSLLRLELRFRRLAMTDGLCQLGATVATMALAVSGAGAAAIVLPQVAVPIARFACYSRAEIPPAAPGRAKALRAYLVRAFIPAALAQYVHNVLIVLEIMVLGLVVGDVQSGLFGFGFTVAAQANAIIAYQLGQVLQPIFGKLRVEPERQVLGLLRAQRVLAAVCVPIALLQAALAEPVFRLLFPKWMDAVPVFQAISISQAFYFSTGPSMACLRAQRRFRALFNWQVCQLLVSVPLFWVAARWQGAVGVAIASGAIWAVSSPIALAMCTSGIRAAWLRDVLLLYVRPWAVSGPVLFIAWMVVRRLGGHGEVGDAVSIAVVGPAALLGILWLLARIDPAFAEVSGRLTVSFLTRIRGTTGREVGSRPEGPQDR